MLDRTFGFDTACTEAVNAIDTAYVESTTNANCIGLVKLMGRHCGFIAMNAVVAARNVDICLLPEMSISLEKVLANVADRMRTQKHMVIVVAEGCGDTIISASGATDAGGNKQLADVGNFLKGEIGSHLKKLGVEHTIKYIDPTYMIRSVRANANDSVYCSTLAQTAVHAAMAGYTGCTVGQVDERLVMLPIHAITDLRQPKEPKRVDILGRDFRQMLATTNQPDFTP